MSGFQVKHFNWLPRPTALQAAETWRARQQAAREDFEANTSAVMDSFESIGSDFASGMASIAASAAVKRLQDAADAKNAQNAQDANSVDLSV